MSKFKNELIVNVYHDNAKYVAYVLKELGYASEYANTKYINGSIVTDKTGVFYAAFGKNIDRTEYMDCGDNLELFFALASMRDDTDKYQLFVSEVACTWINIGMWRNKGDFEFCLVDDYRMGESEYSNAIPPTHKASVEEIKDYMLKHPDYKPYKTWYESKSADAIVKSINDLVKKIHKTDEYLILAEKDIYDTLKKQCVIFGVSDAMGNFSTLFGDRYTKVTLANDGNNPLQYKFALFKNGNPVITVDKDGTIHQLK